jgi:hypothetical protein
MQWPARVIAVNVRAPKTRMVGCKFSQDIILEVLEVFKSFDSCCFQSLTPHLKFNPPDLILAASHFIKPRLATLLLNLSHLVIDTDNYITSPKSECLDLTVLTVMASFDARVTKWSAVKSATGR